MNKLPEMSVGIGLEECLLLVKKCIKDGFPESLWVRAEISQIQERRGHYYLQLVDASEEYQQPARCSAAIWASQAATIVTPFEQITGQPLTAGMNILMLCRPAFHEKYGFSLSIQQIDPTFSMGDIARRRQEIIDRLIEGELLDRNKQVEVPLVFHRIAVFSSQQAAGYQDFMKHLSQGMGSTWYRVELFPVALQGADVRPTFEAAFRALQPRFDEFDCLVIVRGGGAVADLSGFDDELLARMAACCRIPVISGIGHERDNTVVDLVAAFRAKTPTDAAEMIIRRAEQFLDKLIGISDDICQRAEVRINAEHDRLDHCRRGMERGSQVFLQKCAYDLGDIASELRRRSENRVRDHYYHLRTCSASIAALSQSVIKQQKLKMAHMETTLKVADPVNILKRGFSITYAGDTVVKSVENIPDGAELKTVLADGSISSVVRAKGSE